MPSERLLTASKPSPYLEALTTPLESLTEPSHAFVKTYEQPPDTDQG